LACLGHPASLQPLPLLRPVVQLTTDKSDQALPMVACGSSVRGWVKHQYGVSLDVLVLAQITPEVA
jgi:hypothetical protein